MATQMRDEIDQEVIADLARDWPALAPSARLRALRAFPELSAMGRNLADPCTDPARAAYEEETLQQGAGLDGSFLPDDPGAEHFADPPAPLPGGGVPATPPATGTIPPRPSLKATRWANKYRDVARRRRVLAAIASEKELATAIGGHHLPDNEPADVIHLHDALGNPITDPKGLRHALFVRAQAVNRLSDPATTPEQKSFLQQILDTPAHAFEVKTLLKSPRGYVQITPKALARKVRWSAKYAVPFHTVAIDKRRGQKFSGAKVYTAANTVAPTTALANMTRGDNMGAVLDLVQQAKGAKVAPKTPGEGEGAKTVDTPKTFAEGENLHTKLHRLRPQLAAAAQKVYDQWDASDPEYGDPEVGGGGICQDVAEAMSGVLNQHGIDHGIADTNGMGDQHNWIIAHDGNSAFHVDIAPHHYETGSGYSWQKIPGVKLTHEHVSIDPAAKNELDAIGEG